MKIYLLIISLFISVHSIAQETIPPPITQRETSFDDYEILVMALVGLAILLAVYFLWRRRRK